MSAALKNPSREDFAALLDESFGKSDALEGSVIKGRVVAIEKDMAVIDVGLKTEGRVALREFSAENPWLHYAAATAGALSVLAIGKYFQAKHAHKEAPDTAA